ncbi:MAG TPA: hypothetical protein PKD27_12080 [Tepidiformaceae bacterium]|nr:hypothetical protein [Tepidiformaceae bacterium]
MVLGDIGSGAAFETVVVTIARWLEYVILLNSRTPCSVVVLVRGGLTWVGYELAASSGEGIIGHSGSWRELQRSAQGLWSVEVPSDPWDPVEQSMIFRGFVGHWALAGFGQNHRPLVTLMSREGGHESESVEARALELKKIRSELRLLRKELRRAKSQAPSEESSWVVVVFAPSPDLPAGWNLEATLARYAGARGMQLLCQCAVFRKAQSRCLASAVVEGRGALSIVAYPRGFVERNAWVLNGRMCEVPIAVREDVARLEGSFGIGLDSELAAMIVVDWPGYHPYGQATDCFDDHEKIRAALRRLAIGDRSQGR